MDKENATEKKHPKTLESLTLFLVIATAVVGAIIGLQLIVNLGLAPNTAIIGAMLAMFVGRIPVKLFKKYRSVHRQNLIQTSISSATFGAANSLMVPICIPFLIGKPELVVPMLIGATLAMFLDATLLYKLFDSKIFPARGTWPAGIATAEAITAGDQGGKRAGLLGVGVATGIAGSIFGVPMSAFGVAFLGNFWGLMMFGIGLLISGYAKPFYGIDLNQLYIPHGLMIGAGLVALIQTALVIRKKDAKQSDAPSSEIAAASEPVASPDHLGYTQPSKQTMNTLGYGYLIYLGIAVIIAILGGVITDMSWGMLIAFILYAAFAAYVHELIVGIAAMHSGWIPAFAIAFVTLIIGMLMGFPPAALGLLVGFSAATGPAFADMGYDLKTGYILRGNGSDPSFESTGRRQQYITAMIAFAVAAITVTLSYQDYFAQNLFAPTAKVFAATIAAGVSSDIAYTLMIWAIPGALLQWFGGSDKQLGVLFVTGLLLANPKAGLAVLAGILLRTIVLKTKGKAAEKQMTIFAAGCIAGDAVYSFFSSIFKLK